MFNSRPFLSFALLSTTLFATGGGESFAADSPADGLVKPLHRESHMVAVDWFGNGSADSAATNAATSYEVNKPVAWEATPSTGTFVDEAVKHTVYQQPGVYLDQPRAVPNPSKLVQGFGNAGNDFLRATAQTGRDLGQGLYGTGTSIVDGTSGALSATGNALKNVADNTLNIGNDAHFNQRNGQPNNGAQDNTGLSTNFSDPAVSLTQAQAPLQANNGTVGNVPRFSTPDLSNPSNGNATTSQWRSNNGQLSNVPQNGVSGSNVATTPQLAPQQPWNNNSTGLNNAPANQGALVTQENPAVPRQTGQFHTPFSSNGNANPSSQLQAVNNTQYPAGQYGTGGTQAPLVTRPSANEYVPQGQQRNSWTTPGFTSVSSPNNPITTQTNYPTQNAQQTNYTPQQNPATNGSANSLPPWNGTNNNGNNPNNTPIVPTTAKEEPKSPSGFGDLGAILLAVSVAGNFFVWSTYLDIRNKYRSSLRRTPNSYRD